MLIRPLSELTRDPGTGSGSGSSSASVWSSTLGVGRERGRWLLAQRFVPGVHHHPAAVEGDRHGQPDPRRRQAPPAPPGRRGCRRERSGDGRRRRVARAVLADRDIRGDADPDIDQCASVAVGPHQPRQRELGALATFPPSPAGPGRGRASAGSRPAPAPAAPDRPRPRTGSRRRTRPPAPPPRPGVGPRAERGHRWEAAGLCGWVVVTRGSSLVSAPPRHPAAERPAALASGGAPSALPPAALPPAALPPAALPPAALPSEEARASVGGAPPRPRGPRPLDPCCAAEARRRVNRAAARRLPGRVPSARPPPPRPSHGASGRPTARPLGAGAPAPVGSRRWPERAPPPRQRALSRASPRRWAAGTARRPSRVTAGPRRGTGPPCRPSRRPARRTPSRACASARTCSSSQWTARLDARRPRRICCGVAAPASSS